MLRRDLLKFKYQMLKKAYDFENNEPAGMGGQYDQDLIEESDYRSDQIKLYAESQGITEDEAKDDFISGRIDSKDLDKLEESETRKKKIQNIKNLPGKAWDKSKKAIWEVLDSIAASDDKHGAGLSYTLSMLGGGAGGGALGALIAGEGNRLKGGAIGATVGALAMALANYARRRAWRDQGKKFTI